MKFQIGRLLTVTRSAGGWSFRMFRDAFRIFRSNKAGGTVIATPKRVWWTKWDK